MIRAALLIFAVMIIYSALRTLFRSAVQGYNEDERRRAAVQGEEMVQDPECRTYVVKSRAVTRRINGKLCSFCSDACAEQYEVKSRR